jgi:hypothetical protein
MAGPSSYSSSLASLSATPCAATDAVAQIQTRPAERDRPGQRIQ